MKEKIETVLKEVQNLKVEMQNKLRRSMKELFSEFWLNNEDVTSVLWTQYAPYFNDGDPCIFSVNDPVFTNVDLKKNDPRNLIWGEDSDEDEDPNAFVFSSWRSDMEIKKRKLNISSDDIKSLSTFLCSNLMTDLMEDTFGSDSLVIATREGFEIQEYDHE